MGRRRGGGRVGRRRGDEAVRSSIRRLRHQPPAHRQPARPKLLELVNGSKAPESVRRETEARL